MVVGQVQPLQLITLPRCDFWGGEGRGGEGEREGRGGEGGGEGGGGGGGVIRS